MRNIVKLLHEKCVLIICFYVKKEIFNMSEDSKAKMEKAKKRVNDALFRIERSVEARGKSQKEVGGALSSVISELDGYILGLEKLILKHS